jgi:hypothetical protein
MFDQRETAAILAGLRLLQNVGSPSGLYSLHDTEGWVFGWSEGIDDIWTDGGTLEPLTPDEIDALCERINTKVNPCPYCDTDMGKPQVYYDQGPCHVHEWLCPECGASVRHERYAPALDWEIDNAE